MPLFPHDQTQKLQGFRFIDDMQSFVADWPVYMIQTTETSNRMAKAKLNMGFWDLRGSGD